MSDKKVEEELKIYAPQLHCLGHGQQKQEKIVRRHRHPSLPVLVPILEYQSILLRPNWKCIKSKHPHGASILQDLPAQSPHRLHRVFFHWMVRSRHDPTDREVQHSLEMRLADT